MAACLPTIRRLFNRIRPLQRLAEEAPQGCCVKTGGADTYLSLLQQVHLAKADLLWPELIRWTMEMLGKGLGGVQAFPSSNGSEVRSAMLVG